MLCPPFSLQVRQKVSVAHLGHPTNCGPGVEPWLYDKAFKMPYWRQLHEDGRIMFLHLSTQHRFDAAECALVKGVS
jgi:hypothetical protein